MTVYLRPSACEARAKAAGLPIASVRRAIRSGELPARLISPCRMAVREDDFTAWLDAPGRAVEPELTEADVISYTPSFLGSCRR